MQEPEQHSPSSHGSNDPAVAVPPQMVEKPQPGARFALGVLTFINLFNYMDRYAPSACKDLIKADLHLTDAQTSLPFTAFVFVYMAASPMFGFIVERGAPRKWCIAGGVLLWSLATASAALSTNFAGLMTSRAIVGIGEAAYATLAPSMISDFYPPSMRSWALSVFYVAIPIGAAAGFGLGSVLAQALSWRAAMLFVGLPGVLVALLMTRVKEPPRDTSVASVELAELSFTESIMILPRNKVYVGCVLGGVFVTFAAGGLGDWYPTFLSRYLGMDTQTAGVVVGASTAIGGIIGTASGCWLGDKYLNKVKNSYFLFSGLGAGFAALFLLSCVMLRLKGLLIFLLFVGQIPMWWYNGPSNAILVNCVAPNIRSRAFGFSILMYHALGDAISPPIIGAVSDKTGSLAGAMFIVPIAQAAGAAVWLYCAWAFPDERLVASILAKQKSRHASMEIDPNAVSLGRRPSKDVVSEENLKENSLEKALLGGEKVDPGEPATALPEDSIMSSLESGNHNHNHDQSAVADPLTDHLGDHSGPNHERRRSIVDTVIDQLEAPR